MGESLIRKAVVWTWNWVGKLRTAKLKSSLQDTSTSNAKRTTSNGLQLTKNFDGIASNQLVIIFPYLQAKRKHVDKNYALYFLNQRFDVLTMGYPWFDAVWPEYGAKVIANEVAEFLAAKEQYEKIVVYGFSGGAYVWGEVLDVMSQHESKYGPVGKRIIGQVFDSITVMSIETLTVKFPKVIFPTSTILQRILETYLRYHTAALSEHTTRHYMQSFEQLKNNQMISTPILTFASKDDKISDVNSIFDLVNYWRAKGTIIDLKLWDSSPHVQHIKYHKDEYEDALLKYLLNLNVVPYPSKFRTS